MASCSIYDHAVAFWNFNDIVIDDCNSLLIAHALLIHTLSFSFRRRQTSHLTRIFFMTLHILNGDSRPRAFRDRIPITAQVKYVQVFQVDARFGLPLDLIISLPREFLFHQLFFLCRTGYHVKLWIKSTVWNPVVLYFDKVLQIVLCLRTFDQDWTPLDLHNSIVLNVDLSCEALEHGCIGIACILVGRLRGKYLVLLLVFGIHWTRAAKVLYLGHRLCLAR